MATNIKLVAVLIIVFVIATKSTCKKPCVKKEYAFNFNAKAFPDVDSISVGDTIWIEINEPTLLTDLLSGNQADFSGATNLSTAIGFDQLLGNGQAKDAASYFEYKIIHGVLLANNPNSSQFKEFKFSEIGGRYLIKVGIIPQKIGIYRIGLSNASNVYLNSSNCIKASISINFFQTNQHMYFNEINFGVVVPLPNGGYCFKVK
jgi:hypothetical protein